MEGWWIIYGENKNGKKNNHVAILRWKKKWFFFSVFLLEIGQQKKREWDKKMIAGIGKKNWSNAKEGDKCKNQNVN